MLGLPHDVLPRHALAFRPSEPPGAPCLNCGYKTNNHVAISTPTCGVCTHIRTLTAGLASELVLEVCCDNSLLWHVSESYDDAMVRALDRLFIRVLGHALAHPCCLMADIQTIDPDDAAVQIASWNQPSTSYRPEYVFETVEANALLNPNKTALECFPARPMMTYQELVAAFHRVSVVLQGYYRCSDEVIGLLLPRDCSVVVGMLGVLKVKQL